MEDGSTALTTGDTVTLAFTAADAPPQMITLAGAVIGRDAAGEAESWGSGLAVTVPAGADGVTVAKAVLDAAGASYALDEDATLNMTRVLSVTSPTGSGVTLTGGDPDEWGVVSGDAWYPYLNGECFDTWVSRFEEGGSFTGGEGTKFAGFVAGDAFTLYFGAYREKLPNVDGGDPSDPGIEVDPDAPRPDLESPWPGFAAGGAAGGAVVQDVPTPTESAQLDWSYSYGAPRTGVSDPVIAGDWMYVVADGALIQLDLKTGKELARVDTGASSAYFCRPVYADGLIIVPADDGSLAAFTADALTCVWKTPALSAATEGSYQSLSSLTVADGRVYAGFTVVGNVDEMSAGVVGMLRCVDTDDGRVVWQRDRATADTGVAEGWYWAGAAVSGDDLVIGGESGAVELRDGDTGDVLSSVKVGEKVRASIVAVPGEKDAFLAVSYDGTLHKITRTGDELSPAKSVSFAAKSTSTPAVVGGRAFVGGVDAEGYGTLSVIDLATMKVSTVRADKGEVQSSPLVSVLSNGDVWAYFTCNAEPGGVYAYKLGDTSVYRLYVPAEGAQEHCTASVVADAQGNLYYTNDSGMLFRLKAGGSGSGGAEEPEKPEGPKGPEKPDDSDDDDGDDDEHADDKTTPDNTTPITTAPPVTTLFGAIAPNATPLAADAQADARKTEASASEAAKGTQNTGADAPATSATAEDAAGAAASGVPLLAVVGLVAGTMLLLAAVAWLVALRRREREKGAQ